MVPKEFQVGSTKDRLLAPFSKRHAGKVALSGDLLQMKAVMPFLLVSRDDRLAYVKNSKCGCTSIAQAFHVYDHGGPYAGNVHREGRHLRQGYAHWRRNWESVSSGRSFLFSFVRDPVARIVSAYMDFVVLKKNPEARHYRAEFESRRLDTVADPSEGLDRFLGLIEEVFEVDPLLADRHWRPQVLNLGDDLFSYQMIGRMESFVEDVQALREAIGISPERFPLTSANRSGSAQIAPTLAQRRKIRDLYEMDYEAYGY